MNGLGHSSEGEAHMPVQHYMKILRGEDMTVTVEGKMVDRRTIVLDQPLASGQNEVIVRLKEKTVRTKIPMPEPFVLKIAETDIEELAS
jgi:hypothetical protein